MKTKKQKRESIQSKVDSGKIALFTKDVQVLILIRDKTCVLCKRDGNTSAITDYHHALYGAHDAEKYNPERNKPEKGVGLCGYHHNEIHHGITGKGQEYRQYCKDYIKQLKQN